VGHPKNADVQSISHEKHHARDTFRRISVNFCKPVLILDGPTTRRSTIDCRAPEGGLIGGAAGAQPLLLRAS
jgi:hypothetical protein